MKSITEIIVKIYLFYIDSYCCSFLVSKYLVYLIRKSISEIHVLLQLNLKTTKYKYLDLKVHIFSSGLTNYIQRMYIFKREHMYINYHR